MATFKIQQLVELLADDDRDIRTAALTVLSEGYANDRGIVAAILHAWDRFGPIRRSPISQCCLTFRPMQSCCLRYASGQPRWLRDAD